MTLSFCVLTKNSSAHIERLLKTARRIADEVVVAVDSSSSDTTEEVCAAYADKLFLVEPVGYLAPALSWLHQQCSCDWVLRLDDDELPSVGLITALPKLMSDRDITHYWIRRRWLFGEDERRWIDQHPWWPDWQLRLHRNISSIVHVPAKVHTRVVVGGAGRYSYEGSIYHLDFVYHSEEERRQKAQTRYESRAPGKGLAHVYLPEASSPTTLPLPQDDAIPKTEPAQRLRALFDTPRRFRHKEERSLVAARRVGLDELHRASMQAYDQGPELFEASLRCDAFPEAMVAGEWYPVDIEVRNDSPYVWSLPGLGTPVVRVGYRWLRVDGITHVFDTHRDSLPEAVWPGESIRMPSSVLAPEIPGPYVLRWDFVIEDVAWFSSRDWRGPQHRVRVESAE